MIIHLSNKRSCLLIYVPKPPLKVGREAKAAGFQKKHAVMLIPGVISSVRPYLPSLNLFPATKLTFWTISLQGLESWGTDEDTAQFFRKRVWGGGSMVRGSASPVLCLKCGLLILK